MGLIDRLEMIRRVVTDAKAAGYDLTCEFAHGEESGVEFNAQERLRIDTRTLSSEYFDEISWGRSALGPIHSKEILDALCEVRDLFGTHPFHHVIEGRIAEIVQAELGLNPDCLDGFETAEVPPEFQRYAGFKFEPWNNPHLNYGNIQDILKSGRTENIPPDYRGRFASLVSV